MSRPDLSSARTFAPGKVLQYLGMLLLAAGLCWLSFREVRWSDFREGLRSCRYGWIGAAMLAGLSGFLFRALRWRLLLLPLDPSVSRRDTWHGVTIAYLTNFALPRAGEFARCGVVARRRKLTFEAALGTVVAERSFDMACLLLWIVLLLAFKWNEFGDFLRGELMDPLSGKFSAGAFRLLAAGTAALVLLLAAAWIFRRPLARTRLYGRIAGIARGLLSGLTSAARMRHKGAFLLLTLLLWGSYWLTGLLTLHAFPAVAHLGGTDALFLMLAGSLGWVVPVQGGLGAYHFIVSLALAKVYGIPQTAGVVFATLSHESQALVMLVCGFFSLILLAAGRKKIR